MKKDELTKALEKYLPPMAAPFCAELIISHPFQLKITPDRRSKFGDFRPPQGRFGYARISVNGSLNPYAFLTTLLHEIAHFYTWKEYKLSVSPHGSEWKMAFQLLLEKALALQIFPHDIGNALHRYMQNPAASSCRDPELFKALSKYDAAEIQDGSVFLEDIPFNQAFRLENGLQLVKKEKLRTYFRCIQPKTNKEYRVSPIAKVWKLT